MKTSNGIRIEEKERDRILLLVTIVYGEKVRVEGEVGGEVGGVVVSAAFRFLCVLLVIRSIFFFVG